MNATNSQGVFMVLEPPASGASAAAAQPLSPTHSEPDDFPPTPPEAPVRAAAFAGLQTLSRPTAASVSHSPGDAGNAGPSLSGESVMSRFPESSGIGSIDDSGRAVEARAASLMRCASTAGYGGTTATEGETPQTTFYSRGDSGKDTRDAHESPAAAASRAATLSAQQREARASPAAERPASGSGKRAELTADARPASSGERSGRVLTPPPRTAKKTPRKSTDKASKSSAQAKSPAGDAELAASIAAAETGRPPRRAASKAASYAPEVDKDGNPLKKRSSAGAIERAPADARSTRRQDQSSAVASKRSQATNGRRGNTRRISLSPEDESPEAEDAEVATRTSSAAAKAQGSAARSSHRNDATAGKSSTSKQGCIVDEEDEANEDAPVQAGRRRSTLAGGRAFVIADDEATGSADDEDREGDSSAHEDDAARDSPQQGRGHRAKKPSSRLQQADAGGQAKSKGAQSRAGPSRSAAVVSVEVDVSRSSSLLAAKRNTSATASMEPASRLPLKAGGKDSVAAETPDAVQVAAAEAQSPSAGASHSKAKTSPRKRKASPAKASPTKAKPRKVARRNARAVPDSDSGEAEEDEEMATPEPPVSAPKASAAATAATPDGPADESLAGPLAPADSSPMPRSHASKSTTRVSAGGLPTAVGGSRSSLVNRPFQTPTRSKTDGESAGGSSLRRSFSGKPLAALVGASGGHRRPGLGKRSFVPPLHANRKEAPAPRAPLLVKKTKAEERAEAELMLDSDEERERAAETPSQRMRRRIREAEEEPMEPPAGWATVKSKSSAGAGPELSWGGGEGAAEHAYEDYD